MCLESTNLLTTTLIKAFANEIAKTLPKRACIDRRPVGGKPFEAGHRSDGSPDVGDVSWIIPTVGMSAATWVPGTGGQTGQPVAAEGYWSQRHI